MHPAYDAKKYEQDRILGAVAAVEWTGPKTQPPGGWKIPATVEKAPGIRAVASLFKVAEFAGPILESNRARQIKWAVSMEVKHFIQESAFAFLKDDAWTFIPYAEAPAELIACWDTEKKSITNSWNGQRPILLMGGVNGRVHYAGVGIVQRGAEPTAVIDTMLASARAPQTLGGLASGLKNIFRI